MKPACCVLSIGGACRIVAEEAEDIEDRLLELWNTDALGDVGAD